MPVIIPTKACNLRCKHCLRADFPEGDLDLKMMRDFMYDMQILEGSRFHTLTGGEPTLHKNFDELLEIFDYMEHRLSIVTNAQLTKGIESIIKNKKLVNLVNISFDSPIEEENDKIRGKGTFEKALESLKDLQKNNVTVIPVFVIHNHNGHLVDEIFNFVDTYKTTGAVILGLQPVKRAYDNKIMNNDNSYKALKRFYEIKHKDSRIAFSSKHHIGYINPEWSLSFCDVMEPNLSQSTLTPNGDLWVCCDLVDLSYQNLESEGSLNIQNPILGNIKKDTLDVILGRKRKHSFEMKKMRYKDAVEGKLINGREFMCENCKFYHFHNVS
ncbi:MAG: radical SAM protein [Halarcobacter sp.]